MSDESSVNMGLLDFIGGKIQQASEESNRAYIEAEFWDARRICRELQRTSSIVKSSGYAKALKEKCEDMSSYELKTTFEEAYRDSNIKACNVMMPIMEDKDLAYRDDNGRIRKNY